MGTDKKIITARAGLKTGYIYLRSIINLSNVAEVEEWKYNNVDSIEICISNFFVCVLWP